MLAVLTLNFLAAQLLFHFLPLVRTGTPPGPYINLAQFAVTVIALGLSLWIRRLQPVPELRFS
jgi:hypothetical protein